MRPPHRRLFVGGRFGRGRQWFPWIHVEDLVALILQTIEDDALGGPVNAVAPEQVRQRDLAKTLGRVLRRPAVVPAPVWALRAALGEQADLLLHGQRAVPAKACRGGFEFRYPKLEPALMEALR